MLRLLVAPQAQPDEDELLRGKAGGLAEFALQFSSYEYFWLATLGLTCAVFMSAQSRVKSVASLLLGLTVATVGLDVVSGQPRFTFGSTELLGGIHFIPALIGMFAVSEVLRHMTATSPTAHVAPRQIGNVFRGVAAVGRRHWRSVIRGNAVGVGIGVLPGAGGDIAAWIAYAVSKGAIHQRTASLSDQMIDSGISVNCINPGPIDTGYARGNRQRAIASLFPARRWGQPAARLIAWLASDEAEWITGQVIDNEGGFRRWQQPPT